MTAAGYWDGGFLGSASWLDEPAVKPIFFVLFCLFVLSCKALGWLLSSNPPTRCRDCLFVWTNEKIIKESKCETKGKKKKKLTSYYPFTQLVRKKK